LENRVNEGGNVSHHPLIRSVSQSLTDVTQ
jgi:hypothetical protein